MGNSLDFNFAENKYNSELQNVNNSISEKRKKLNEVLTEKYVFSCLPRENKYFQTQYNKACEEETELTESISELEDQKENIKRVLGIIQQNM